MFRLTLYRTVMLSITMSMLQEEVSKGFSSKNYIQWVGLKLFLPKPPIELSRTHPLLSQLNYASTHPPNLIRYEFSWLEFWFSKILFSTKDQNIYPTHSCVLIIQKWVKKTLHASVQKIPTPWGTKINLSIIKQTLSHQCSQISNDQTLMQ